MTQEKLRERAKSIKRIKFSDITWDAIKRCVQEAKNGVLVNDKEEANNLERFYEVAIASFVPSKGLTGGYEYISPPREGDYHSLWLEKNSVKKVKYLSERDKAYENRIIYTAIINYLSNQEITAY